MGFLVHVLGHFYVAEFLKWCLMVLGYAAIFPYAASFSGFFASGFGMSSRRPPDVLYSKHISPKPSGGLGFRV